MDDYKPNSNRFKEGKVDEPVVREKKVEAITTATVKKKGEMKKFTDIFISEDVGSVKSYILMDVLVPAIKKAISDIVTNGIDMVLYGESGRTKRPGSTASKVSYRGYYNQDQPVARTTARTAAYDYDDVILPTRGEAEEVLSRIDDLIATYGVVSVADLYDLVNVSCNYTDNKYGWTNLVNVVPVRASGGGYILKLPRALPLN